MATLSQPHQPAPIQPHPQQGTAPANQPPLPKVIAEGHRRISSFSDMFLLMWACLLIPPVFVAILITLLVKSWRTRYRISTDLIEIWVGVFDRKHIIIRPGETTFSWITRSFPEQLTGNATLCLTAYNDPIARLISEKGYLEISGLGNHKKMEEIARAIRESINAARNTRHP